MKLYYFLFFVVLVLFQTIESQAWIKCRGSVAKFLKPAWEGSDLSWAVEGTAGFGQINDISINNQMVILALDYSFSSGKHQIYAEAVWKNWYNSESESIEYPVNAVMPFEPHFAPRELYYKYNSDDFSITAGLQTMELGDYFLVDERSLGVKYNQQYGAFSFNTSIGNVHRLFARHRKVCGMKGIYNLTGGGSYNFVSKRFVGTNLFGAVLIWDPNHVNEEDTPESDEFSQEDEFEDFDEFDEFESVEPEEKNFVKELGLVFYQEFGRDVPEYKYYFGALAAYNLPFDFTLEFEPLFQLLKNENSIGFLTRLRKDYLWDNGQMTDFSLGHFGMESIDDKAQFYPSFANLYIGEVMRMDVREMPMVFSSIRHKFPWKTKFFVKLSAMTQLRDVMTNEQDLEFSLWLFGHFKISTVLSRIESKALNDDHYMIRAELRAGY